jgi:hypothetical protein
MLRAMCVLWLVSLLPGLPGRPAANATVLPEQTRRATKPVTKPAVKKVSTEFQCPADLGSGVKTKRPFCDVTIGSDPAGGIVMRIPPHTGTTVLRFDLHNRFSVSGAALPFARAAALVDVLNASNGSSIERAGVAGELRKELDLFDRIVGTGPGGTKTVAPGRAQATAITVPAAVRR